jgi:hypothetical protein
MKMNPKSGDEQSKTGGDERKRNRVKTDED